MVMAMVGSLVVVLFSLKVGRCTKREWERDEACVFGGKLVM